MSGEQTTDPVLNIRLHRPGVDRDHVQRRHLVNMRGQGGQTPLTLISTPAGCPKTMLISRWRESGKPDPLKKVDFGEQHVHACSTFDAFTSGVTMSWKEGKRK